jgi:disulfide bond formation protein DsbB
MKKSRQILKTISRGIIVIMALVSTVQAIAELLTVMHKAEPQSTYLSFEPTYTSAPAAEARPRDPNRKGGKNEELGPVLGYMPDYVLIMSGVIVALAFSGFLFMFYIAARSRQLPY